MTSNTDVPTDITRYLRHGAKVAGGSDDWQTSLRMWLNLNNEFKFTLDAAASHDNALCRRYWTADDNALAQDWSQEKNVFCNPPFSLIEKFLALAHLPETCVMLAPMRPQTGYWLSYVWANPHCHELRILHRGVRFDHPEGKEAARAPLPVAILVFHNIPHKHGMRITVNCADTLLPLQVVAPGGKAGRPLLYDPKTLDKIIQLHERGMNNRVISEQLKMPHRTVSRIANRLY